VLSTECMRIKQMCALQVLQSEGLGRYVDPAVVAAAQREIAETYNLNPNQIAHAAQDIMMSAPRYMEHMGKA
jgi:hypothetical protein